MFTPFINRIFFIIAIAVIAIVVIAIDIIAVIISRLY